jgi:hypothetical protein
MSQMLCPYELINHAKNLENISSIKNAVPKKEAEIVRSATLLCDI